MNIVFLGTADFAVSTLKILVENDYNVVGVVTATDKPSGRGMRLSESAVKLYAKNKGLNILQPEKLKNPEFLEKLKSLKADLQIVVAFRMLPEVVWQMPLLGTVNLHSSLLPQYRGAAPINWAIINGEKETGVSTFFLKHEIDTGNIIYQNKLLIDDDDTAGIIYAKLMEMGAKLVLKTVQSIKKKNVPSILQDLTKETKHAPKIFKEDCKINWLKPIHKIRNFIRGLSPYPCAWTKLEGKVLRIYSANKLEKNHQHKIGDVFTDNRNYVHVAVNGGFINLITLQLEGKKKMDIKAFLNGYKFKEKPNLVVAE
jgi:methionyl-tRNA formyltransferase